MKRTILIVLLICLLSACGGAYDRVEEISGVLNFYETTLEGLENRVPHIVKGRLGDDAKTAYSTRHQETPSPSITVVQDNKK
jgi:hypothetical protein